MFEKAYEPVPRAEKLDDKLAEQVPGGSKLAPGQATAIVTGGISLVLGVSLMHSARSDTKYTF